MDLGHQPPKNDHVKIQNIVFKDYIYDMHGSLTPNSIWATLDSPRFDKDHNKSCYKEAGICAYGD